ncbi:MAG: GLPGLI family protein [Bacteroidales bacterium]
MKKNSWLILCSVLFVESLFAQVYTPHDRDAGAKYPIDTCRLLITYDFDYVVDTTTMRKYNDRTLLEIGDSINRYYSLYADMCDSLAYNYYKDIPRTDIKRLEGGVNNDDVLKSNQIPWYFDVYTYPQRRERVVSTRFDDTDYIYPESVEPLNWQITVQVDSILGYVCHKAIVTFRKRTWEVWFAPDLPYSFGPWKLDGLPGLILKAADTEGLFVWMAVGLENPSHRMIHDYADKALNGLNRHPFIVPSHKKKTCKRKDLDHLWHRQWLAPLTMMFLDGEKHIIYDMSLRREVQIDVNHVPEGYYPKLELDI